MINTDRIVPITATDLISMYGLILKVGNSDFASNGESLTATNPAEFDVTTDNGVYLAAEPVKTLDFASGVSGSVVYFIPAYDYSGFSINGTAVTTEGAEVEEDGRTLYSATLASGTVTIAQVGF